MPKSIAQHKFEFGGSLDPVVILINFGTYIENGPGFHDINRKRKLAQAGSGYFTYWPFMTVGVSLGAGIRNFGSQISYTIPDPYNEDLEPAFDRSYPFSAKGWGPVFSIHSRTDRLRARIGLGNFDLMIKSINQSPAYLQLPLALPCPPAVIELRRAELVG